MVLWHPEGPGNPLGWQLADAIGQSQELHTFFVLRCLLLRVSHTFLMLIMPQRHAYFHFAEFDAHVTVSSPGSCLKLWLMVPAISARTLNDGVARTTDTRLRDDAVTSGTGCAWYFRLLCFVLLAAPLAAACCACTPNPSVSSTALKRAAYGSRGSCSAGCCWCCLSRLCHCRWRCRAMPL